MFSANVEKVTISLTRRWDFSIKFIYIYL